jgi:tetratricopeptide (TPR) repeat protein
MKQNWLVAAVILLALLAVPVARVAAQEPQQPATPQQPQAYTKQEYDDFNAAVNEKDATRRVALLDGFATKYPSSTLLPYVYRDYVVAYTELKNNPKVMDSADKFLSLGDKVDSMQGLETARLQVAILRAQAFFAALNARQLTTNEQFATSREAAQNGLKLLDALKKPENAPEDQFKKQIDAYKVMFHSVIGFAAQQQKDAKGAIEAFRAALAITPNDGSIYYRIGLSYLQQDPPQYMDGFWAVARSIALKVQGEAQIRTYLRNQMLRYQQPVCDNLLDAQINELITLAGTTADRPENFKIPTRADLDKVLTENGTVELISENLKAGGDKAKNTWLAACGAEFPELLGKVIEVGSGDGDAVVLKIFSASTQEATEAGTAANMELHIEGQPRAKGFKKDDIFVFAGALKNFTPEPFTLTIEKGKVREDTLPTEAKAPPKKAPPKKAPAKRPATKRPPA